MSRKSLSYTIHGAITRCSVHQYLFYHEKNEKGIDNRVVTVPVVVPERAVVELRDNQCGIQISGYDYHVAYLYKGHRIVRMFLLQCSFLEMNIDQFMIILL